MLLFIFLNDTIKKKKKKKKLMNYNKIFPTVLNEGSILEPMYYCWDQSSLTFKSNISGLMIDFTMFDGVTLFLRHACIVKLNNFCNVTAGSGCIFDAGSECKFDTSSDCIFKTLDACKFKTESDCTFNVKENCEFFIGSNCTIINRGFYDGVDIIKPKPNKRIRLKEFNKKGFYKEEELLIQDIIK